MKDVHIRSYFGPQYLAFGLNTERYGVLLLYAVLLLDKIHNDIWIVLNVSTTFNETPQATKISFSILEQQPEQQHCTDKKMTVSHVSRTL